MIPGRSTYPSWQDPDSTPLKIRLASHEAKTTDYELSGNRKRMTRMGAKQTFPTFHSTSFWNGALVVGVSRGVFAAQPG